MLHFLHFLDIGSFIRKILKFLGNRFQIIVRKCNNGNTFIKKGEIYKCKNNVYRNNKTLSILKSC